VALAQEPPAPLTRNAIRLRLRRVLAPRADGTFLVPEKAVQDFEGDNKDQLYALFEKSGYDKDRVEQKRCFQKHTVD